MKVGVRTRKYIIGALGLVAVLALLYVLFGQQLGGIENADDMEIKKKMYRTQLETKLLEGPYELNLEQYNTRLAEDKAKLLQGESHNVAESELLKILTDFAEKSGMEITQKTIQPEKKVEKDMVKVSARIAARCSIEQLVQFLTDIRNYNRHLTVDELMITTRTTRNRQVTELRPTVTVSGFISATESGMEENEKKSNI